jgi:ATP-binding cassette, subfamily B, bacterial CvaB/MchF/RaxB
VELKMLRLQGERLADIVLTAPEADAAAGRAAARAEMPTIELRDVASATPTASPRCCAA